MLTCRQAQRSTPCSICECGCRRVTACRTEKRRSLSSSRNDLVWQTCGTFATSASPLATVPHYSGAPWNAGDPRHSMALPLSGSAEVLRARPRSARGAGRQARMSPWPKRTGPAPQRRHVQQFRVILHLLWLQPYRAVSVPIRALGPVPSLWLHWKQVTEDERNLSAMAPHRCQLAHLHLDW
jgi:hypothetical protein